MYVPTIEFRSPFHCSCHCGERLFVPVRFTMMLLKRNPPLRRIIKHESINKLFHEWSGRFDIRIRDSNLFLTSDTAFNILVHTFYLPTISTFRDETFFFRWWTRTCTWRMFFVSWEGVGLCFPHHFEIRMRCDRHWYRVHFSSSKRKLYLVVWPVLGTEVHLCGMRPFVLLSCSWNPLISSIESTSRAHWCECDHDVDWPASY